jgi:threonine dehydrogenase-like Zn-dependent dehydrogenase
VPDEAAVYATDMMSTGFMGAENAAIPMGGTVAVFAQGAVGLMATAGARLLGAGLIIAVESIPKRQELARRFGADVVIDFTKNDPVAEILRLTGNQGVDSAIDALGSQDTFEAAIRATRPGGTIVNIGFHAEGDYIKIPRAAWGNGIGDKTIRGGMCPGGKVRMQRLLRIIETGRVDPTPLTTHCFPFAELDRAFYLMEAHAEGIIKPLISY